MANIALPASVRVKHIDWSLDRPAQVNRSAYTGSRAVVANPWHGMWRAKVQLAAEQNPTNILAWKAFFAQLKGQINTFQLPATESAQYTVGTVYPTITNVTNVALSGPTSNAYTITKTGGVDGYNASAVSSTGFTGDFSLRIKHLANGTTANAKFAGVSPTPTADNTQSMPYSWMRNDGTNVWDVRENGAQIIGNLSDQTYCWIWRVGTTLGYGRGLTLATAQASPDRTVTGVSSTLYFDSSFYSLNDSFEVLFSGNQNIPTAASGAAQGATSITLSGAPGSLSAGMLATVTLPSGNKQLVMLTQDMASSVITFEPPLREAISTGASVDAANPTCMLSLASSDFSWSVDPGTLYTFAFDAEEAF